MSKFIFIVFALSLMSAQAFASRAGCNGTIQGKKFSFLAEGSLNNRQDGTGYVRVEGREVARFDGAAADVNYLARKFTIRNDRGDVVEGKLHNIVNGRSTLRRLSIPSEGIEVRNAPVVCWFRR